jgi:RNA polymerase sigma-70 factor (ECF subfamily)
MTAPAPLTDADLSGLLARTALGDAEAFAQLYDATCASAYTLATHILRNEQPAQRVLQQVYIHVWEHAAEAEARHPRAWVLLLTHRHAIALRRRSDAQAEAVSRQRLGDMSIEQQRVIALAYFGGYSQTEIAALTGETLSAVRSLTRGALDQLQAAARVVTSPITLPRATGVVA